MLLAIDQVRVWHTLDLLSLGHQLPQIFCQIEKGLVARGTTAVTSKISIPNTSSAPTMIRQLKSKKEAGELALCIFRPCHTNYS